MIDKNLNIYDSVCTGCSACTEACNVRDSNANKPIKLITNEFGLSVPRIAAKACTRCMACYKACPVEDNIFHATTTYASYQHKINNCFYGYSLDEKHRFEAATAGVTTEIAAYLLDTKQVDGVVSCYQNASNEINTEIFTSSADIRKTCGSIYRQVTLLNGLVEKIENHGCKKILLIGLPCHIAGFNSLYKTSTYLKKNVQFTSIALFCKQTKTEEFSAYERQLLGANPNQKINYRGKGWPGITRVEGREGLPFTNIRFSITWSSFAFAPSYCFSCSDPLGTVADISIGDAWLRRYYGDKLGSSLLIANTHKGRRLLEEMALAQKIHLETVSPEDVVASQNTAYVHFKTSNVQSRAKYLSGLDYKDITPAKSCLLFRWLRLNKSFVEFLCRYRIVKYLPGVGLKIYAKANGKTFGKLLK